MCGVVYVPHRGAVTVLLIAALVVTAALLFLGVVGKVLQKFGFTPLQVLFLLAVSLIGSTLNIPITKLRSKRAIVEMRFVRVFGVVYTIPRLRYSSNTTLLMINVGGAIVPIGISLGLLIRNPGEVVPALIGIAVVTVITYLFAKPVPGFGIATPIFIPPAAAALTAFTLPTNAPYVVAYVSGVLGSLIGADLLNLNYIPELGAPAISIGGGGTFDGIFLSGIIAILLTY